MQSVLRCWSFKPTESTYVFTAPADALAPNSATSSADTVLTTKRGMYPTNWLAMFVYFTLNTLKLFEMSDEMS